MKSSISQLRSFIVYSGVFIKLAYLPLTPPPPGAALETAARATQALGRACTGGGVACGRRFGGGDVLSHRRPDHRVRRLPYRSAYDGDMMT